MLQAEYPGLAYWHFSNNLLEDMGLKTTFQEFCLAWYEQQQPFPPSPLEMVEHGKGKYQAVLLPLQLGTLLTLGGS